MFREHFWENGFCSFLWRRHLEERAPSRDRYKGIATCTAAIMTMCGFVGSKKRFGEQQTSRNHRLMMRQTRKLGIL